MLRIPRHWRWSLALALAVLARAAAGADALATPTLGVDASAWAGGLSYRGDTPRRDGRFAGAAMDLRWPDGVVAEAGVEVVSIAMRYGPAIRQDDVTIGIGMPIGAASRLRAGVHQSWDPVRDRLQAQCAWIDGTTYGNDWSAGCGAAASSETVAAPAVRTAQVSPHVGWSQFGGTWTCSERLGALGGLLDRDPGVGVQRLPGTGARAALSVDGLVAVAHGPWSGDLTGWCGRRCYAVIQDGYEVDDCPALYRGGFAVDASWRWRRARVAIGAGREFFSALFAHGQAHIDHVVLTMGASF